VIERVQMVHRKHKITKIKLVYLVEATSKEPWFIGTEFCQMVIAPAGEQTLLVSSPPVKSPKLAMKIPLVNKQQSSQVSLLQSPYAHNDSGDLPKPVLNESTRSNVYQHPDLDSFLGAPLS